MAWTYDPVVGTSKDKIRLLIGDTDEDNPILQDEEIDLFVTLASGSVNRAAAHAARGIASRLSQKANKSVGDLRIFYSDRTTSYLDLACKLDAQADRAPTSPYAGGISWADKQTAREDTDRVDPAFRRGQFQDPANPNSFEHYVEDEECDH